jgi:rare lipoprotein A
MKALAVLLATGVLLTACTSGRNPGGYYQDDGPQSGVAVDFSRIPDAVPKPEPVDPARSRPYTVMGQTYYPMHDARGYREIGIASWYGRKFHGQRTATGERYDMYAMTAAHKTLPLPSYARVTNLVNHRSVVVRINDRGPFLHNRLIDLSYAAAMKLGIVGHGTGRVEVTAIVPGDEPPVPADGVKTRPLQAGAPAPGTPVPANLPADARLYLQVGAFSVRASAEKLRARLEAAGLRPVFVQAADRSPSLFRVRIGPVRNRDNHSSLLKRVADFGIRQTHWVAE